MVSSSAADCQAQLAIPELEATMGTKSTISALLLMVTLVSASLIWLYLFYYSGPVHHTVTVGQIPSVEAPNQPSDSVTSSISLAGTAGCEEWCILHIDSWLVKCDWDTKACAHCPQCPKLKSYQLLIDHPTLASGAATAGSSSTLGAPLSVERSLLDVLRPWEPFRLQCHLVSRRCSISNAVSETVRSVCL